MKYVETDLMKNIVLAHIKEANEKNRKERGSYFYASEGYLPHNPKDSVCARQLGYKILGYKPTEKRDDMYPIFAIGDLLHDFIQRIFVKEKLATQVEDFTIMYDDDGKYYWIRRDDNKILIKEPVEIHGRLDLKFKVDHTARFIADIKTISEKGFDYLHKPKEGHYAQLQIYLHHTLYKQGFILYINKSSGEMKEFMIEYDEEYAKKHLANFKRLYDKIKNKGLPDRHFKSGQEVPWQCKYCGFTKECLGLTLKQVQIKKFVRYEDEGIEEEKEPSVDELADKMIKDELE